MASIWIVSEDPALARTVALPLHALGELVSGPPERSAFKGRAAPALVVLVGWDTSPGDLGAVERLLAFLAGLRPIRRSPAPALYVEPPGGHPPAALFEELIDDRPVETTRWLPDAQELLSRAKRLIDRPLVPPSLRARTRGEWVRRRVDQQYAGLDLPALRGAVVGVEIRSR